MTTRIGTPYFENYAAALRYYEPYNYADNQTAVDCKLKHGEIYIGKPVVKPGERLLIDKNERRYIIESIK